MVTLTITELKKAGFQDYWLELIERRVGKKFELTLDNYKKLKDLNIQVLWWILVNEKLWTKKAIDQFSSVIVSMFDTTPYYKEVVELSELCIIAELNK